MNYGTNTMTYNKIKSVEEDQLISQISPRMQVGFKTCRTTGNKGVCFGLGRV